MADLPKTSTGESWTSVGVGAPTNQMTVGAPTNQMIHAVSTITKSSRRSDANAMLSGIVAGDTDDDGHDPLALPPTYPLPLLFFVCVLAIICGFVVQGVHVAIKYAGCPLGLNGCNDFTGKEKTGFFLVRWVKTTFGDDVPEDVVYVVCAFLGAVVFTEILKRIPEKHAAQVRGGGTVQALVAVAAGERITFTSGVLRVLTSSIYLGTAGTLGMDGPAIQVCTAVTTSIGWFIGMRAKETQSLLACLGFAGGFAASFNSPLAGIMFAMEELQHISPTVSRHIICIILMTSVVATTVSRLLNGDSSLFDPNWGKADGSLHKVFGQNMWMLISVPIAVVCSFAGLFISRALDKCWELVDRSKRRVPYRLITIVMVTASAAIGSGVYQITGLRGVWGIGYESLQQAFNRDLTFSTFFVIAVGKALAMVVSLSVKCPGDMLEPVLLSGAFLGGAMGSLLEQVVQDEILASQVVKPCIVFGMVSLFASCFRFPLTPVVIVLEFMGEETYAIVLPTALAGFTAITVSNRLFPPLLDRVMHRENISLERISEETFSESVISDDEALNDRDDIESDMHSEGNDSHLSKTISQTSSRPGYASSIELSMMSLCQSRGSSRKGTNSSYGSSHGTASLALKASLGVGMPSQSQVNRANRTSTTHSNGSHSADTSLYRQQSPAAQAVVNASPHHSQSGHSQRQRINTGGSHASNSSHGSGLTTNSTITSLGLPGATGSIAASQSIETRQDTGNLQQILRALDETHCKDEPSGSIESPGNNVSVSVPPPVAAASSSAGAPAASAAPTPGAAPAATPLCEAAVNDVTLT